MKKIAIVAALLAAAWVLPAAAAGRGCYSTRDLEAEQALLFLTNLMVASSACQHNDAYAEFALRNRYAILAYQNSLQEGALPIAQMCQKAADLFKLANTLDPAGFRKYAAARAQSAVL